MLNWKDVEKNLRAAAFARPKLEAKFKDFADSLGVLKRLTIQPHQDIQISGLAENNSFTSTFLGQKLRFSFSVFFKRWHIAR